MSNVKPKNVISLSRIGAAVQPIPASWKKAAGLLKGKSRINPVAWQRRIRRESERRLKIRK